MTHDSILEVEDLTVRYHTADEPITAVTDVSFGIDAGEYFGIVGESGCGKSTMAKAILGALDDNAEIASGSIRYKDQELVGMTQKELNKEVRWKEISYIPQGSMNSLDPLMRVENQAINIAQTHTEMSKSEALEKFKETFEIVGLDPERTNDYPHQFSGGMQQRAIIALALFLKPSFLVADEPTTALDVIMQDQIFKYIDEIQDNFDTSIMLITHDISLIFESCDRMAVMHSGQIAETGTVSEIYHDPRHPYAILLQDAFPDIRDPGRELSTIKGIPQQQTGEVDYCTFVGRCPWEVDECTAQAPPLERIEDETGTRRPHRAACIRKHETPELNTQRKRDARKASQTEETD
jgi:oligopeptide/dipeptide ABC transporter ATP-binding protein